MPNYRIQRAADLHAEWDAHAQNMWDYLSANPGSTLGQIATGMGLDSGTAQRVLQAMYRTDGLWRGHDVAGNEFYWTIVDSSLLVIGQLPAARTWADSHGGSTVAQMAQDLGVHQAIAIKMAHILEAESDVKLTVV